MFEDDSITFQNTTAIPKRVSVLSESDINLELIQECLQTSALIMIKKYATAAKLMENNSSGVFCVLTVKR